MVINAETHTHQSAENESLWRARLQVRHLDHFLSPQSLRTIEEKPEVRMAGHDMTTLMNLLQLWLAAQDLHKIS